MFRFFSHLLLLLLLCIIPFPSLSATSTYNITLWPKHGCDPTFPHSSLSHYNIIPLETCITLSPSYQTFQSMYLTGGDDRLTFILSYDTSCRITSTYTYGAINTCMELNNRITTSVWIIPSTTPTTIAPQPTTKPTSIPTSTPTWSSLFNVTIWHDSTCPSSTAPFHFDHIPYNMCYALTSSSSFQLRYYNSSTLIYEMYDNNNQCQHINATTIYIHNTKCWPFIWNNTIATVQVRRVEIPTTSVPTIEPTIIPTSTPTSIPTSNYNITFWNTSTCINDTSATHYPLLSLDTCYIYHTSSFRLTQLDMLIIDMYDSSPSCIGFQPDRTIYMYHDGCCGINKGFDIIGSISISGIPPSSTPTSKPIPNFGNHTSSNIPFNIYVILSGSIICIIFIIFIIRTYRRRQLAASINQPYVALS